MTCEAENERLKVLLTRIEEAIKAQNYQIAMAWRMCRELETLGDKLGVPRNQHVYYTAAARTGRAVRKKLDWWLDPLKRIFV